VFVKQRLSRNGYSISAWAVTAMAAEQGAECRPVGIAVPSATWQLLAEHLGPDGAKDIRTNPMDDKNNTDDRKSIEISNKQPQGA
jgi:hypothetical protein